MSKELDYPHHDRVADALRLRYPSLSADDAEQFGQSVVNWVADGIMRGETPAFIEEAPRGRGSRIRTLSVDDLLGDVDYRLRIQGKDDTGGMRGIGGKR